MTYKIRHPMGLRHPLHIVIFVYMTMCKGYKYTNMTMCKVAETCEFDGKEPLFVERAIAISKRVLGWILSYLYTWYKFTSNPHVDESHTLHIWMRHQFYGCLPLYMSHELSIRDCASCTLQRLASVYKSWTLYIRMRHELHHVLPVWMSNELYIYKCVTGSIASCPYEWVMNSIYVNASRTPKSSAPINK